MHELIIGPELVGREVRNAARPEWGVGRVRSVTPVRNSGRAAHRVVVDFPVSGAKTMLIPPARLAPPGQNVERTVGWIETLGGKTEDDRLERLPESVTDVLGSPRARLAAAITLYRYDVEDPKSLLRWAFDQTGSPDPLARWSRDELVICFQRFALERDAHLRAVATLVRIKEGPEALRDLLDALEEPIRERVKVALARVI